MTIFAVINQPGTGATPLATAIRANFPSATYELGDGAWLIATSGTAQTLAERLKIVPNGESGSAVVLEVGSYYGRANPAIWTWMKTNWETAPNG